MGSRGKASTSKGKGPAAALSEDISGIEDSDTFTVALATVAGHYRYSQPEIC